MDTSIWITIVSTMGGLELFRWLATRRSAIKQAKTAANSDEFHLLRETIEFLQQQLLDKEARFAEQTSLVRQLNRDNLDLTQKTGRLEAELLIKRCDRLHCAKRKPPTALTDPNSEPDDEEPTNTQAICKQSE